MNIVQAFSQTVKRIQTKSKVSPEALASVVGTLTNTAPSVLEVASLGLKFKQGRKKNAEGEPRRFARKHISTFAHMTFPDVWAYLYKLFREEKYRRAGYAVNGSSASQWATIDFPGKSGVSYRRFENIISEEKRAFGLRRSRNSEPVTR